MENRQAARIAELRSRCVTELAEFDRITQHIDEPVLVMNLRQRRIGLLAQRRGYYRVKMRGLKMRIIAIHNSVRKCGYAGVAIPVWKLAERLGVSTSHYRACMRELQESGVFVSDPYSIDKRCVNRHDLRRGRTPRCYSRSRRANVVTFGGIGLRLIGVGKGEDRVCTNTSVTTYRIPEGNCLDLLLKKQKKSCGEGVSQSSTGDPSPSGDSLSPIAHETVAVARTATWFTAWLAKNET